MSTEEHRRQLEQLLGEASLAGDQDKITELETDLRNEFSSDIGAPSDAGCGLL